MDTTFEIWKPIVGWEDLYEVSDHGRVRSLDRIVPGRAGSQIFRPARIRKLKRQISGHMSVPLSRDGKSKFLLVHAVVLEAFVGPRPKGYFGCHNDGNPSNNQLGNLRWDTPKANSRDSVKHGVQRPRTGTHQYEYEYAAIEGEEWRPVVGYEGIYEVSSVGRVRMLDMMTTGNKGSRFLRRGHLKNTATSRTGHLSVHLAKDGVKKTPLVHALVLEAFVGPRPDGMLGCHGDGNPANNRVENLRWDTPSNNVRDTVKHGTHPMAGKTHCKHGHEFTPENTIVHPKTGYRACRACGIAEVRKRRPLSPNGHQRDRTHCPQGHEYSPENTIVSCGSRSCRTCVNDRKRAKRDANRVQVTARICETCNETFMAKRSDARNCSHACRAQARNRRIKAAQN